VIDDPARRRARELVMALRPSIARRCGVHADGVDTMTDQGLLAWRVAIRQLIPDLASDDRLTAWARSEDAAEASRWQDGSVVLGLVNQWLHNSTEQPNGHELTAVVANVAALRQRAMRGQAAITDDDVRRAGAATAKCGVWQRLLADELDALISVGPTGALPYRCTRPATPLISASGVRALHAVFAPDRVAAVAQPKVAS
jgi:hypothetical protein